MTLVSSPLVSVVTPVFNGEPHLRECIESVLAQTYTNWEYTIVNNCSADRTVDIAREYATKDSRIRVHNNDAFVGVMENHNVAFRLISPESQYCKVIAADDWMFPECLERMVRLAESHPDVAIVGAYQLRSTGLNTRGLPYQNAVFPGRTICRMQLLGGPYVLGPPTAVLYRSSIVRSRHAFYHESNLHSDEEVCVEFLEHREFGFVHQILTFGRVEKGSMTSFSERFNTHEAGLLNLLVKHGPKHLARDELDGRIREVLRWYYRSLARGALRRREAAFWQYHRTKLAELGYPLSSARLAAATSALVLDLLLNPKGTLQRMRARTHRLSGDRRTTPVLDPSHQTPYPGATGRKPSDH